MAKQATSLGLTTYLFDQPYNRGARAWPAGDGDSTWTRVLSLEEARQHLLADIEKWNGREGNV